MQMSTSASGELSGATTRIASTISGLAAASAAASGEAAAAAGSPPPAFSGAGGGSFVLGRLRSGSSMLKRSGAGIGVSADGSPCLEEEDAEARSLYLQVRVVEAWPAFW
jgi:hypothetical protein